MVFKAQLIQTRWIWPILAQSVGFMLTCDAKPLGRKETIHTGNLTSCVLKDQGAICHLVPNPNIPSDIKGTIYFRQTVKSSGCEYNSIMIQVNVVNLPDRLSGYLGFHVHKYGDMSGGCESMGPHYNPRDKQHGSPWQKNRHIGDLGNVDVLNGNVVTMRFLDYMAFLVGPEAILGRGIVLHENKDDFGNGNNAESKITGNAGRRLACCVITATSVPDLRLFNLYA